MIEFFLGFVAGFFFIIVFRAKTDAELESTELTMLLESVEPEQLQEMAQVLTPMQMQILFRMLSRRECAQENQIS